MYKVLIVDDEPIVKIALRSIICWEDYDYTIIGTASDGKEALEMTMKECPDLVITDLKMPKMDGLALIKSLKENNYAGEILVISNYEDFEYVRSALVMGAVDYILKVSIEADTLTRQLQVITERLNASHTSQLLSQTVTQDQDKQQHTEVIQQLKMYLEVEDYTYPQLQNNLPSVSSMLEENFAVCYLDFRNCSAASQETFSTPLVLHTLEETLADFSSKELLFLGYQSVLILISSTELKEHNYKLPGLANKLDTTLQLYLSLSPVIVYEDCIEGIQRLKECYHNYLKIVSLSFYDTLGILSARTCIPLHYMNFIYYKDFAAAVQGNNLKGLKQSQDSAKKILDQCQKLHIYPEITKKFFEKTLEMIEYMNPQHSIEVHDYLADQKEAIRNCNTGKELLQLISDSFETIYAPASNIHDQQFKQEIKIAIDYINHNYHDHISLNIIADKVNLSSSYLCRLFKSEVGMSITNYINQVRMEKAGEILRNRTSSPYMKEIALSIGIDDQLYFSRLFKKYYHMSPSEYREEHQK